MKNEHWLICKHCPLDARGRPLAFHEDDREDFLQHLRDHGVSAAIALEEGEWWDEEGGFSISPEDRVKNATPLAPTQFGDGSDTDKRRNAREFRNLRELEATSRHDTPAWRFEGATMIAEGRGEVVKPARSQAPPQSAAALERVTPSPPSAVVKAEAAGGLQIEKKRASRTSRKERKQVMATATRNKPSTDNPYAGAPVVDLSVSNATGAAPRICVTTGRGFTDTKAIRTILELVQKAHANAVIVNQGRWEGDQIVGNIAQSMGLGYEAMLPKFIEARRRGQPVIDQNERMTPEQNAEFGYIELQKRLASTCTELHVFGTPSGPQRGLQEAFSEAEKKCFSWGSAV